MKPSPSFSARCAAARKSILFFLGLACCGSLAWAANPVESQEVFQQLPLTLGRSVKHQGEASAAEVSAVLAGPAVSAMRAVVKVFSQAVPGPHPDQQAIGSADFPEWGVFLLYRGHDFDASFWKGPAQSLHMPAWANGLPPVAEGENVFYVRSPGSALWKTAEYSFGGEPVWMSCSFIIVLSPAGAGTRVEVRQLATLLPGRRLGLNAHTMAPTSLYDWREAPEPTNLERRQLLERIRRAWDSLPATAANAGSPWPQAVAEKDAFLRQLPALLSSKRLRVEGAQVQMPAGARKDYVLDYQLVNDSEEAVTFPPGFTLRHALTVWTGLEPLLPTTGTEDGKQLWGQAFSMGFGTKIPEATVLRAHERLHLQDHFPPPRFHPGSYRVHLLLRAWNAPHGPIVFDRSSATELVFDLPPALGDAAPTPVR